MTKHSQRRAQEAARRLREAGEDVRFEQDWTYLSGTMSEMPIEKPLDQIISDAERAIRNAQSVRKAHARKSKRGAPQREADINIASEAIHGAMRPLRRRIARLPYGAHTEAAERLREASTGLQRERRKLWKMKNKSKKKKKAKK